MKQVSRIEKKMDAFFAFSIRSTVSSSDLLYLQEILQFCTATRVRLIPIWNVSATQYLQHHPFDINCCHYYYRFYWIVIPLSFFIHSIFCEMNVPHNSIFRNHNFLLRAAPKNDYSFISNATLLANVVFAFASAFWLEYGGHEHSQSNANKCFCAELLNEWSIHVVNCVVHATNNVHATSSNWLRYVRRRSLPLLPHGNSQVSNCIRICTLFCAHTHKTAFASAQTNSTNWMFDCVQWLCGFWWNVCLVLNAHPQRKQLTTLNGTRIEHDTNAFWWAEYFGPNDAWGQLWVSVMNCQNNLY